MLLSLLAQPSLRLVKDLSGADEHDGPHVFTQWALRQVLRNRGCCIGLLLIDLGKAKLNQQPGKKLPKEARHSVRAQPYLSRKNACRVATAQNSRQRSCEPSPTWRDCRGSLEQALRNKPTTTAAGTSQP